MGILFISIWILTWRNFHKQSNKVNLNLIYDDLAWDGQCVCVYAIIANDLAWISVHNKIKP